MGMMNVFLQNICPYIWTIVTTITLVEATTFMLLGTLQVV